MTDAEVHRRSETGHAEIVRLLDDVGTLGISSRPGQRRLLDAREQILAHLKREDDELYAVLRRAAETNPGLETNLDMFAKDMKEISTEAMEFFDRYAQAGSEIELAREAKRLAMRLRNRIGREESVLYKEFEFLSPGEAPSRA